MFLTNEAHHTSVLDCAPPQLAFSLNCGIVILYENGQHNNVKDAGILPVF